MTFWSPGSTDAFLPCYKLSVSEMDALISRLFVLCSMNPHAYVGGLNTEARRALESHNASSQGWFPQPTEG
jgi:hypothetical protein